MSKFDKFKWEQLDNHYLTNQSSTKIVSLECLDKAHSNINIYGLDLKAIQIFSDSINKLLKTKFKRNIQISKILLNYKRKKSKIKENNIKALTKYGENNYNFFSFIEKLFPCLDLISKMRKIHQHYLIHKHIQMKITH